MSRRRRLEGNCRFPVVDAASAAAWPRPQSPSEGEETEKGNAHKCLHDEGSTFSEWPKCGIASAQLNIFIFLPSDTFSFAVPPAPQAQFWLLFLLLPAIFPSERRSLTSPRPQAF